MWFLIALLKRILLRKFAASEVLAIFLSLSVF